ncbi:MAG: DUF4238 domain-containing protein [Gammaproteobacteria bacterium]|nr:DUF4238 domain-containing protein [Gammaproteobacteria bacterium]
MDRPRARRDWASGTVVRKLFPEVDLQSISALTAIWDEVVERIATEMLTLNGANRVELHVNVREEMVLELAQLQSWLAEKVVEKRVAGRDLSSIDPDQEKEECLGSDGKDTISATARIIHDGFWSKRLEERWKPKSAKAAEREANPPRTKLAVKPVGKNHFIPRWFIRDHWAVNGNVLRWRRTSEGWTSKRCGFGQWGYRHDLYSDQLEAYFGLLEGDAKRPIEMLLETSPLNSPQREALVGFLVIQFLRNPYTIAALHRGVAPVIAELGHGDDPKMPRKAYESLYGNNDFYDEIASPLMWSPWAMIRSERPVFVLPDTFAIRMGTQDGMRLIAPLTPTTCFVTLPGREREKRIVPRHARVDEDLCRRISLALIQAAVAEFLSGTHFSVPRGEAEPPRDLLKAIARVLDAGAEGEDITG